MLSAKEKTRLYDYLLNDNYRKIRCYVFSILQDDEEAKDVVQDIFCELWHNIESVDDRNVRSYLFTAAKWKCWNLLKKRKLVSSYKDDERKKAVSDELAGILLNTSWTEYAEDSEIVRLISESMNSMPEKTREAFRMSRFEACSYKEIAEKQGCTVKNIEYRIMSALRILHKNLKDYLIVVLGIAVSSFLYLLK